VFMRRAVYVAAMLLLVFLVISIAQSGVVDANPNFISPYLSIDSPNAYRIYQTTSVPIEVHVLPAPNTNLVDLSYILDGAPNVKLSIIRYENTHTCTGKGTMYNLTDGYHKVIVLSTDSKGNVLSDSNTFLVNTTFRYPTFLLSPQNITYYSNEIPLTYSLDKQLGAEYSLDNSGYKQLRDGNTTLTGLSEGQHIITVTEFSVDDGIYSIQAANFTVDTTNPSPVPTPSPTVPEFPFIIIVTTIIVVMTLAISFFKRKAH
jgi:hypothetical protein